MEGILGMSASEEFIQEIEDTAGELVEGLMSGGKRPACLEPVMEAMAMVVGEERALAYSAGIAVGIRLVERRRIRADGFESLLGDIEVSLD